MMFVEATMRTVTGSSRDPRAASDELTGSLERRLSEFSTPRSTSSTVDKGDAHRPSPWAAEQHRRGSHRLRLPGHQQGHPRPPHAALAPPPTVPQLGRSIPSPSCATSPAPTRGGYASTRDFAAAVAATPPATGPGSSTRDQRHRIPSYRWSYTMAPAQAAAHPEPQSPQSDVPEASHAGAVRIEYTDGTDERRW